MKNKTKFIQQSSRSSLRKNEKRERLAGFAEEGTKAHGLHIYIFCTSSSSSLSIRESNRVYIGTESATKYRERKGWSRRYAQNVKTKKRERKEVGAIMRQD